jgi:sugar porter (SP) family MFS transporter
MPPATLTLPDPAIAPKIFAKPAFLWKISIIGGLAGILYGYDSGIVTAAGPYFNKQFGLSDTGLMANIIVSSLLIGVMIGSLAGGQIADRIGRRLTILNGAIIFIAGSMIAQFAQNTDVLILARFVLGLSIGFTSVTAPVYLSELAPPQSRGKLIGFYQLYFTLGMALSSVVGYAFTSKDSGNWHAMFGVGAIPAAVLFLLVLALPESPRWLCAKGHTAKATEILDTYTNPEGAAFLLEEIHTALKTDVKTEWSALFTRNVRPSLFIASVFLMLLAVTGINAVFYYGATIFKLAGVADTQIDIEMTIILTSINVVGTIVGMLLIDKIGRKPLLYAGLSGMTVSLFLLAAAFYKQSAFGSALGPIALTCLIVYIACFAFSLGVIAWVIASEVFPLQVRGRGIAAASTAYGLVNFIVTLTFGPLVEAMGAAATFLMYGVFCIATLAFVIIYFPETKGVELEEISKRPT